mmetsp:Transcript_17404/g.56460  ORF Transcript_17404/g.56460 Transcript_17404/m.56460 type:complete len:318 (-) Transcript_17404:953-1906(-)
MQQEKKEKEGVRALKAQCADAVEVAAEVRRVVVADLDEGVIAVEELKEALRAIDDVLALCTETPIRAVLLSQTSLLTLRAALTSIDAACLQLSSKTMVETTRRAARSALDRLPARLRDVATLEMHQAVLYSDVVGLVAAAVKFGLADNDADARNQLRQLKDLDRVAAHARDDAILDAVRALSDDQDDDTPDPPTWSPAVWSRHVLEPTTTLKEDLTPPAVLLVVDDDPDDDDAHPDDDDDGRDDDEPRGEPHRRSLHLQELKDAAEARQQRGRRCRNIRTYSSQNYCILGKQKEERSCVVVLPSFLPDGCVNQSLVP